MLKISKFRAITTIVICLLGLLFAIPSFVSENFYSKLPSFMQNTVNLGLELRGGSHLQLEVGIEEVAKEYQEGLLDETRRLFRKNNIKYNKMFLKKKIEGSEIVILLKNKDDIPKAKKILLKIERELDIVCNDVELNVGITRRFLDAFAKRIVSESIEIIRHRIDESGTKEPTILAEGKDRIIVQLPGVEDPAETKRLIGKTALLTFHAVEEDMEQFVVNDDDLLPNFPQKSGVKYLPEERKGKTFYIPIKTAVSLTGKSIVGAEVNIDQSTGAPCVAIKYDAIDGTRKMAELSAKYLHKQFAMVLDGKVLSAPVFQAVINTGSAQITGQFTMEEASELALLLRAGALPAPLTVVEERTVGPSLGADSIADGKKATILAFVMVSIFMILSYGLFGLFSVMSLFCNIMLLFVCLTMLSATLTLPGIAGIALTIGMAVDANVLIYERIREEIRGRRKAKAAIANGYKMAMMTILDSNFTTLIGAIVLYEFGSGPIKGFAVTLAIGTIISLFTTFSLTKLVIFWWTKKKKNDDIIL